MDELSSEEEDEDCDEDEEEEDSDDELEELGVPPVTKWMTMEEIYMTPESLNKRKYEFVVPKP